MMLHNLLLKMISLGKIEGIVNAYHLLVMLANLIMENKYGTDVVVAGRL